MEASFLTVALTHPAALAILALCVVVSVFLGGAPARSEGQYLSRSRILGGLCSVLVAALVMAVPVSYVSPSDAARFGVQPANYWNTLGNQFFVQAVLMAYFAVLGCAAIGVPVLVQLVRRRLATVPLLVAASVPISLAVVLPVMLASSANLGRVVRDVAWVTGAHALLAFAFAIGARLPWRRMPRQ